MDINIKNVVENAVSIFAVYGLLSFIFSTIEGFKLKRRMKRLVEKAEERANNG